MPDARRRSSQAPGPPDRSSWYRWLVDHASDVITALTPEGEIRYESPALTRVLGYEPDELVGTNALELTHPEDRDAVATALRRVTARQPSGEPVTVELRFRHADGHWVPFESRALQPAGVASGLVVVLSRNITERREAECALQRSLEKYATFFEMVPVGVVLSDPDTGHMHEVNERFQQIFGYSRDELVGRTALELELWEDPERRAELVRRVQEEGGFKGEDAWHRREDGERIRTLLSCRRLQLGGQDRVLWTVQDVTGQWRQEEQLHLQRDALEATDHAIVITDREGRIEWVNPAFTQMTGYAAEEALGRTPRMLRSGEQPEAYYDELWETILRGQTWRGEIVNRRKDGTTYTEWQSIVPVRHRSEEITHFIALKRDVSREKAREEALEESEERYRSLFENSLDPVVLTRPDGAFLDVNEAFLERFGYSREELSELSAADLYTDASRRDVLLGLLKENGEVRDFEIEMATRDGDVRTCRLSSRIHRDAEGGTEFLQTVVHDITDRKRMEERLRHQALHDPLTGLGNRVLLQERLARAVARAERDRTLLGLAIFDFDRFKRVNDSLGHTAGDRVLEEASARFNESTRDAETIVRLGGDEFAVLLENVKNEKSARTALERIAGAVHSTYRVMETDIRLEGSVGVALYRPGGGLEVKEPGDLLRYADLALYQAKHREDRSIRFYEPEGEGERLSLVAREHDLQRAIEAGELACYYQPIRELDGGRLAGLEVLARWPHPERGLLGPDDFIELAAESGLIVPLGHRLFEEACQQLARWDADGLTGADRALRLFVNLSPRQLAEEGAVDRLLEAVVSQELDPGRLVMELTETAVMRRPGEVDRLTDAGIGLAIDDFGTGYASLAYLKLLDVDLLKIDRSFVGGLGTSREDTAIVEAVIGLASSLGIEAVAEGIETGLQESRLREMGCAFGQGFRLGRPVPADEVDELLADTL